MNSSTRFSLRPLIITGSDTSVGKTVLSALFLTLARELGIHLMPLKPFCSGGREDAKVLQSLAFPSNGSTVDIDRVNPWHFELPLAPYLAAHPDYPFPTLKAVLGWIQNEASNRNKLIIEGAGGLLSPLGKDYTILDIGTNLHAKFVVVVANRLGAINQARLCIATLESFGVGDFLLCLNHKHQEGDDLSRKTNTEVIKNLVGDERFIGLENINLEEIEDNFGRPLKISKKLLAGTRSCDKTIHVLCDALKETR